jgi:hypothetical protein
MLRTPIAGDDVSRGSGQGELTVRLQLVHRMHQSGRGPGVMRYLPACPKLKQSVLFLLQQKNLTSVVRPIALVSIIQPCHGASAILSIV